MESTGLVAELGLKDAAADAAFDQLLQKIEKPLELAFVSISDWVSTANGGKAHDVGSYRVMLQLAQTSIVEMHMVITSWSLARFEQQLESVMACLAYLSLRLWKSYRRARHHPQASVPDECRPELPRHKRSRERVRSPSSSEWDCP